MLQELVLRVLQELVPMGRRVSLEQQELALRVQLEQQALAPLVQLVPSVFQVRQALMGPVELREPLELALPA